MAFEKKTWTDRVSEYPTRRNLIKSDGTSELVTVERSEGSVSVEGDAFEAATMNDMEKRISEGFSDLGGLKLVAMPYSEYKALNPPETNTFYITYK